MNPKWMYKRIGDVCLVERGGSPRPIDDYITEAPDGINWIKIGDTSDSMYMRVLLRMRTASCRRAFLPLH